MRAQDDVAVNRRDQAVRLLRNRAVLGKNAYASIASSGDDRVRTQDQGISGLNCDVARFGSYVVLNRNRRSVKDHIASTTSLDASEWGAVGQNRQVLGHHQRNAAAAAGMNVGLLVIGVKSDLRRTVQGNPHNGARGQADFEAAERIDGKGAAQHRCGNAIGGNFNGVINHRTGGERAHSGTRFDLQPVGHNVRARVAAIRQTAGGLNQSIAPDGLHIRDGEVASDRNANIPTLGDHAGRVVHLQVTTDTDPQIASDGEQLRPS